MTRDEFVDIFCPLSSQSTQKIQSGVNSDLLSLIALCSEFIAPPIPPKNALEHAILVNRGLVAAEFLRLYVDKNISVNKLGRYESKELKELIQLQARLWNEVWKTIQQMYTLSLIKPVLHESLFFQSVIMEQWLTEPFLTDSNAWNESLTATKMFKQGQNLNRSLQTAFNRDVNPCNQEKPYTWSLLQASIGLAERSDEFRRQYLKMVAARMSLIEQLRHSRPEISSSNEKVKPEKRGRKPKKS